MREYVFIPLLCPKCGEPLEKSRYRSKGNWVTWCRIRCINKSCEVDTGNQVHLSAAYEALSVMYFGAHANIEYEQNIQDECD